MSDDTSRKIVDASGETSLAAMLDAVAAAVDPAAAAAAIVALQRDLVAATASRLVRAGDPEVDHGDDAGLIARAAAHPDPVFDRRGSGAVAAVAVGHVDGWPLIAVHVLANAAPLTLALAGERLALSAALACSTGWPAAAAVATALADSGLDAAATAIAVATGASGIVVARLRDGVVTAVGDGSAGGDGDATTRSSAATARLKLAAGEAFDLGTVTAGMPLPPALRELGEQVTAVRAVAGSRAAVVIATSRLGTARLEPFAALVSAVRPPAFRIIPEAMTARVAARLPWPAGWTDARRRRVVRRGLVALPLLLLLAPVPTTVDAAARVEALTQRIVTAPFDGRIEAVLVQPGDAVHGGQTVLLSLDARTAENERVEAAANQQAALTQAETAQVDGRGDDERIARLRAAQYGARAEALALQVAAATITAPIDGVAAGDDLRKRTGAPVTRGESLLSVAAPGSYRVEARVPDRDIGVVHVGQRIAVALKARPLDRPRGTVTRIYPLAEVEEGDNVFRVVARLDRETGGLLPGMEGRASIRTGWAPLGWLIVRAPLRWVRLKLWI